MKICYQALKIDGLRVLCQTLRLKDLEATQSPSPEFRTLGCGIDAYNGVCSNVELGLVEFIIQVCFLHLFTSSYHRTRLSLASVAAQIARWSP
jgi:hypothetical protein